MFDTDIMLAEALQARSGTAFRRLADNSYVSVTRKSNGDWPESITWRHDDREITEAQALNLLKE